MNIGEIAKSSGVSARMIRHYEESGLIRPAMRTGSNYRVYTARDVEVLHFVSRARHLGFSTTQISALLALWEDRERPSSEVKQMVTEHINDPNERIRELVEMRETSVSGRALQRGLAPGMSDSGGTGWPTALQLIQDRIRVTETVYGRI